jgi:hypothetical protein
MTTDRWITLGLAVVTLVSSIGFKIEYDSGSQAKRTSIAQHQELYDTKNGCEQEKAGFRIQIEHKGKESK